MKPEDGKWYRIEYIDPKEPDRNYVGIGQCLELSEIDIDGNELWNFEMPDNISYGLFGEEDIVKEVESPHQVHQVHQESK